MFFSTVCPAGKFAQSIGLASCSDCQEGKLSSEDRTFCSDCLAGQYSFNDLECRACDPGKYAPRAVDGDCLDCRMFSIVDLLICVPAHYGVTFILLLLTVSTQTLTHFQLTLARI